MIRAQANSSSAQDRLSLRLKESGCLVDVQTGKVLGEVRKSFEMTMTNNCYYEEPKKDEGEA